MVRNLILLAVLAASLVVADPVGYKVETSPNFTLIAKGQHGGELYRCDTTNYQDKPFLVNVRGSRAEMGFDWGFLLAKMADANYNSLLASVLGPKQALLQPAVELFLDWQWNRYLSKQVPEEFMEELEGVHQGGLAAGVKDLGKKSSRGVVLANLPSDTEDMPSILIDELLHRKSEMDTATIEGFELLITELSTSKGWFGMQCSMFALWGDRTDQRRLFSARNLDWNKDTGINKNKLISVFHPDGKTAHATMGFAGLFGALAGMSAKGISVHEANLEEKPNTFRGFPWTIRLRYIMENADDIASAKQIWETTNNTVGFNHMVASATDAKNTEHGAMVFETMAGYTAYFLDNDVREQTATRVDSTNQTVQVGFPLKHALWRTNNGFDPQSVKLYQWNLDGGAGKDSQHRYMIIHDAFVSYNASGVLVSDEQAINVTSILGSKGDDFFRCNPATYAHGSNVLSVTFAPSDNYFYSAWEDSTGATWSPACCNAYVRFDMARWFV